MESSSSPEFHGSQTSVLISAAERSGDAHAAKLVREVRSRRADVSFHGFGGELLREAGCKIHADVVGAAAMGFKFLRNADRFLAVLRDVDRILRESPPAAVVLVDSPGLNFLIARLAKWRGVPVVYYICPQIWAWGPWRRSKVLRYCDLLLTIMPFEEALYRNPRVPVQCVGHPLGDAFAEFAADEGGRLRQSSGIGSEERVIGLLPGSREHEVRELMPIFRRLLEKMEVDRASCRVLVSAYREAYVPLIEEALRGSSVEFETTRHDSRTIAAASDFLIVASGTASLEVAYLEKPMVVLYQTGRLRRFLFRLLRVTPYFALPNILGASLFDGEPVVPEHLCIASEDLAPVAREARALFENGEPRRRCIERLGRIKQTYLGAGASAEAASALLDFLGRRVDGDHPSRYIPGGASERRGTTS